MSQQNFFNISKEIAFAKRLNKITNKKLLLSQTIFYMHACIKINKWFTRQRVSLYQFRYKRPQEFFHGYTRSQLNNKEPARSKHACVKLLKIEISSQKIWKVYGWLNSLWPRELSSMTNRVKQQEHFSTLWFPLETGLAKWGSHLTVGCLFGAVVAALFLADLEHVSGSCHLPKT